MGCLCSKGTHVNNHVAEYEAKKETERSQRPTELTPPVEVTVRGNDASRNSRSSMKSSLRLHSVKGEPVEQNPRDKIINRPASGHRRNLTLDSMRGRGRQEPVTSVTSIPHGTKGEAATAGWPPWLTSVAGEAVKGWAPRSADSYEKLKKVSRVFSLTLVRVCIPFSLINLHVLY